MAACERCGRHEATKARFGRAVCAACASIKLSAEEWRKLAPSVALMALFLTGVSFLLPMGTLAVVKMLLAQLHG